MWVVSFSKLYSAIKDTGHLKKFGTDVSSVIPFLIFSARRRMHHNFSLPVTPGLVFLCVTLFWTEKIGLDIEVMLTIQQKYARENIWNSVVKVKITLVDVWRRKEHSEFGNMLLFILFHFLN